MIGVGLTLGSGAAAAGQGGAGPAPFKVAIWGQSEDDRILSSYFHTIPKEPLLAEGRVTFWSHSHDPAEPGAAGVRSVLLDATSVATDAVTPPMIRMANTLIQAMPGRDIHILMMTLSGSAPQEIMDDGFVVSGTKRRWQDDWALHAAATADGIPVGYGWHSWFAAPGSWADNYGQNMCAFLLGRALDGSPLSYSEAAPLDVNGIQVSRTLRDLYGADMPLWIAPGGAHAFVPLEDLASATLNAAGGTNTGLWNKQRSTQSWRAAVSDSGLSAYFAGPQIQIQGYANGEDDGTGTWSDQSHPSGWTEEGYNLRVTQIAHAILRGAGLAAWPLPVIDGAEWEPSGAHVDVWSSAGPITTLRRERGDPPLGDGCPHWTDVLGFQIDGAPATRAEIQHDGRVRVYPNAGSFSSATTLTFGEGGATGWIAHDADAQNAAWRDYPIVDLGLYRLSGVPVRPLPADEVLVSTIVGAPTFTTSTAGPYFIDPVALGSPSAVTIRVKGSVDFAASGNAVDLAEITGQVLQVQVLTNNGALRFYVRNTDGSYLVQAQYAPSGTVQDGVAFDLVVCLDHATGTLRAWVDGAQVFSASFGPGTGFQSVRNLALLGEDAGNMLVGTFDVVEAWKSATPDGTLPGGTPHVSISGPAGVVNAHPWKAGADAT